MRSGLHFLPDLRKQCPPRARQLGEPPSHQKRTLTCLKAPFQRERPRTRFSCLADCPGHGLALPGGRRAELPGEAGGSRRKEWEPEQPWPRLPPVRGRFPLRPASLQRVAAGPAVRPAPRAGLGPSRPPHHGRKRTPPFLTLPGARTPEPDDATRCRGGRRADCSQWGTMALSVLVTRND